MNNTPTKGPDGPLLYRGAFPLFDRGAEFERLLAALQAALGADIVKDGSYKNDVCPRIDITLAGGQCWTLWLDFADPDLRENDFDATGITITEL